MVFKGDANYRRLFEDRQWAYTATVSPMIAGTAIPMAIIRVLKSEIVVGQKKQLIGELKSSNPHWLIDGSYGLIYFKI